MTTSRIIATLPRLLGVALCALPLATLAADDDEAAAAQACVSNSSIKSAKVIDARNIAFVMRDGAHYVNQLRRECPGMRRNSVLNYAVAQGRLCAGSSFAVLWQMGVNYLPTATCQLGLFLPRTEDEIADLEALSKEARGQRRRRAGRDMIEATPVETEPTAPASPR